jgi:uncharacterized membrane protein HdeD (DUF308 family)
MPEDRIGILTIIIGFILLMFPAIGANTTIQVSGIFLLAMGIYLFITVYPKLDLSIRLNWLWVIVPAISILMGFSIGFQILLFDFLISWVTATGLLLLMQGLLILRSEDKRFKKNIGIFGVVLGVIYLITGIFSLNVLIISILIAFGLIIYGLKVLTT